MAIDKIFNDANVDGIADNIFGAVNNSVSEVKAMQQRKAAENVQMVVEAFKKIETNITEKFDNVTDVIEKRVLTIKDGRDGSSGSDGRNGRDGKPGRDGVNGKQGPPGTPGKDGVDGEDGVSVTNANIDFDGSLVISLSTGQQINVGEVVAPDLAEKIKIVSTMSTNGAVGIKDEGSSISTGVKNINFVGATVTATASGDDVTVNVSAGTGTVQSVAATVPAFLSVAGSPITTTGTLAISLSGTALPVANGGTGLPAGTSGGVLAYTAAGTLASSTALAASALVIGGGAGAAPSTTTTGTGVVTALGVNTGTAGAFVVNGGALGSPSSVGTMPAFTLGGTVSGGGNQINNVIIGTSTPLAGAFTSLTASTTLGVTGVSTLTGGAVVQGLTVGLGAGAVATNTAVGASALATNSTGSQSTAVGYQAANASNASVTAIGSQALLNNTTGAYNTAVGQVALKTNTTGAQNSALGVDALFSNTTGGNNVAVGMDSLFSNTTASNNTAVGYQAAYNNTTGQHTVVGKGSLYFTTISTGNAILGYDCITSGSATTNVQYNTAIGNTSLQALQNGATYNTAVGFGSGSAITTGAKNSILGAYTGNQGGLDIRTASNYIVLSDGDGNPRMSLTGSAVQYEIYSGRAFFAWGNVGSTSVDLNTLLPNINISTFGASIHLQVITGSSLANQSSTIINGIKTISGSWTFSNISSIGSMSVTATGSGGSTLTLTFGAGGNFGRCVAEVVTQN